VQEAIDLLSGPDVAIDEKHGPMLYAMFLRDLLRGPMAQVDLPISAIPQRRKHRKHRAKNEHANGTSMDASYFNHSSPFSESSPSGTSMSPPATSPSQELPMFTVEEASPSGHTPTEVATGHQMNYAAQYGAQTSHSGVPPTSPEMMQQQQQQSQQYWTTPELAPAPFPFDSEMMQSIDSSFSGITLPGMYFISLLSQKMVRPFF
jgi:hypothetical protein